MKQQLRGTMDVLTQRQVVNNETILPLPVVEAPFYWFPLCIPLAIMVSFGIKKFFSFHGNALVDAPVVGPKFTYLSRLQFFHNAWDPIQEGYQKV